jgi:hypothetical protein
VGRAGVETRLGSGSPSIDPLGACGLGERRGFGAEEEHSQSPLFLTFRVKSVLPGAMTIIVVGGTAISQQVPVPVGRTFTVALRGTAGGLSSFKAQWYDGVNWNNYVATDCDLAVAGEFTAVNVGSVNEIKIVSTGNNGSTDMRAVINTVPIDRPMM